MRFKIKIILKLSSIFIYIFISNINKDLHSDWYADYKILIRGKII
jgi:hypothetical protein